MKNHRSFFLRLIVLAALLFPSAVHARGQGLGRINGTVTDSTGATVPNATITATRSDTNATVTAISSNDGSYVIPSLPPAIYSITANAAGFARFSQSNVLLQADQAVT